jgi:predicted hydrocarbon binding protein
MTPSDETIPCPAAIRSILMEGGSEVVGPLEAARLLDLAQERNNAHLIDISLLHKVLKDTYGERGGQGVARRFGQAAVKYGLRHWGGAAGFTTPEFRLLPSPKRIHGLLKAFAHLLGVQYGARVHLEEDPAHWFWKVERCPACHERSASAPDCNILAGVLQEILSWTGGGRFYPVFEIECCAVGAQACLFQIDKKPLD